MSTVIMEHLITHISMIIVLQEMIGIRNLQCSEPDGT